MPPRRSPAARGQCLDDRLDDENHRSACELSSQPVRPKRCRIATSATAPAAVQPIWTRWLAVGPGARQDGREGRIQELQPGKIIQVATGKQYRACAAIHLEIDHDRTPWDESAVESGRTDVQSNKNRQREDA